MEINYRRVAFLGEDGLLARTLCDSLDTAGFEIMNSYRHNLYNFPKIQHSSLAWTSEIDASNLEVINALCKTSEIIINCAGLVNTDKCKQDIYGAYRSNVKAAEIVASCAKAYDRRLIHFATTASYGSSQLISEEAEPSIFQTIYSGTKLLGETLVKQIYPKALIIRPCFVYGGERDTSSVLKTLIYRSLTNNHPFLEISLALSNKKDYLWVEDFAEAIKILILTGQTGTYNISRGEPRTYSDILDVLAEAGIKVQNVEWKEGLDYLGNHLVSNEKIKSLGWSPKVSLEEGVRRIVKDFEAKNFAL